MGRQEVVVMVHGMGRTKLSMLWPGKALERQGYRVVNWGYTSTRWTLPELGEKLADFLMGMEPDSAGRVHFVGHSLGNILVRWVLMNRPDAIQNIGQLGRVVMLAPPNQGSMVADKYAGILGWLLVPIRDLRTAEDSTVRGLACDAVDCEVGIIAGKYDGKVTVEETQWTAAKAHVVVPAAHTMIMNRADVHELVVRFLRTGDF